MQNTTKKSISLPSELAKKIKDYQHENQIASYSEAIAILVQSGLRQKGKK